MENKKEKVTLGRIASYLLTKNPYLSRSELSKLVFLLDYNYCKRNNETFTGINWEFNQFGPFTHDTEKAFLKENYGESLQSVTAFGAPVTRYKVNVPVEELPGEIQEILDHFLAIHKAMNYNEFIKFVYNTYPVKNSKKGQYLNIPELVEKELDEEVEEVWEDIIENFDDVMVELAK